MSSLLFCPGTNGQLHHLLSAVIPRRDSGKTVLLCRNLHCACAKIAGEISASTTRLQVPARDSWSEVGVRDLAPALLEHLSLLGIKRCFAIGRGTRNFRFFAGGPLPNIKPDYNLYEIGYRIGADDITFLCGGLQANVSITESLESFRNIHSGIPGWVLANGPSLNSSPVGVLKDSVTFSMNGGYRGFQDWGFQTTYWVVIDSLQIEKYFLEWQTNVRAPTIAFFPYEYNTLLRLENSVPLATYPPQFPHNDTNFKGAKHDFKSETSTVFFSRSDRVYLGHSVAATSIALAYWMGCDPIIVLGLDHTLPRQGRGLRGAWHAAGETHFSSSYVKTLSGYPREFSKGQPAKLAEVFGQMHAEATSEGRRIINASAHSKLRALPRKSFDYVWRLVSDAPTRSSSRKSGGVPGKQKQSVTVGISTANIQGQLFAKVLSSVKNFSTDFDVEIVVLDNSLTSSFNHAENMNRTLEIARGDFVLFLDEDVEVTSGYLHSLLESVRSDTGAVGMVHWDGRRPGNRIVSHAGVEIGNQGVHPLLDFDFDGPNYAPAVSSAALLVVDKTTRFPEKYEKYFFDIEYCLTLWERQKTVVIAPHPIFHLRGSGFSYDPRTLESRDKISNRDFQLFKREWLDSGRYSSVASAVNIRRQGLIEGD